MATNIINLSQHDFQKYRKNPQFPLAFDDLVIDNFSGGGGASTGIEMSLGRSVDIAVNHDIEAIAMHTINHPNTQHYCENVWDVNPRIICNGKKVKLLWLSPDCKHFSKAKGSKPADKNIRGLAWIAVRYAATVKPDVIMLENVEEFITWGRVGRDGKPCPKNKGETFKSFVNALIKQGYNVDWKELRACDFGTPTIRKRLFLIARCDRLPIIWPEATHGDPSSEQVKKGFLKPYRTAAEIIDWSIPCPSIYERSKPLAVSTMKRIEKGIMKFAVNNDNPVIINNKNGGLILPFITEHANASSQRNFPINEPLRTICAQVKGGHFAVVCAFLVSYYGNSKEPISINKPLHTITTKDRFGLVVVKGQNYQIADIGMRMLEPKELYAAQGFPSNYIFDRTPDGKKLTKVAQVRMCGNSVCPPIAAMLVNENIVNIHNHINQSNTIGFNF